MSLLVGATYVVSYPFVAEGPGELSVAAGQEVSLLEVEDPSNVGWLLVKAWDGRSGFVPRDFLVEKKTGASFAKQASARMSIAVPPAMLASSDYGQFSAVPPAMQPQGLPAAAPAAAPVRGADLWAQRDRAFGQARSPVPPLRRWFYRDLFGDMQGPFSGAEMRTRLDARHVQPDTPVLVETGSGAVQAYDERPLRDMFADPSSAFTQAPRPGPEPAWYYRDDASQEQGPFSSKQMRVWFDEGYFGSQTQVRPGQQPQPRALSALFQDPITAFMDAGQAGAAKSQPFVAAAVPVAAVAFRALPQQQQPPPPPAQEFWDPFGEGSASAPRGGGVQKQASGRVLLQEAYMNAGPVPPPQQQQPPQGRSVDESSSGGGGGRGERAMTYEDTLDLFDRVGLDDDSPASPTAVSAASAKSQAAMRIYGSTAAWGEFKGVPEVRDNPSGYATALYNFFTRPLHPGAGKVLGFIKREVDGIGHMNYNKFTLFLEQGPTPVAVAYRHYGPMSTTFEIKMLTTAREDNTRAALTVAKLEVNFLGTQFILHNGVPGHQGRAKDLCVIMYEKNRMGNKGPRKMKIGIPDIEKDKPEFKSFTHGGTGSTSMLTSLQSINMLDLVPFINKPPKWNAAKGAYSLDFGGRVSRASVKNFQLVDAVNDHEHSNVCMQHGRVGQDKFTMDVQHPFSLVQAFAICLSSLHQKKAVD